MPVWLPYANLAAVVTVLVGMTVLAGWMRGRVQSVVKDEVSRPLSDIEHTLRAHDKEITRIAAKQDRSLERIHTRIDALQDTVRKGQTNG